MRIRHKPALAAATLAVTMAMTASLAPPAMAVPATIAVTSPEIPGTPVGEQLGWLLEAIARTPIPENELTGHFAAGFLKEIPAAQLNQVMAAFKDARLEKVTRSQDRTLVARVTAGGTPYDLALSVDAAGKIDGLRFTAPTPATWDELNERLARVAPTTGFLAAELTRDGTCRPLHAVAAGKALPLGSMFKLYVLGAVAEAVKKGEFGWDTRITITPELKSVPSGELQDRPDGSEVTVLEAAKLMISISDNTGTDLLIHQVGRKAVERTMRAWGVRDARNVPLLTTREWAVLKGAEYPKYAKRFLSLSDGRQRAYLESVVSKVPLTKIKGWTSPREMDTLEWFASPAQVCRAYAGLVKLGGERIGEIMSINDAGLGLDRKQWPQVWFKGGSEPGLLDLGFLARTSGGKTYVTTAMALDPKRPLNDTHAGSELLALVRGAFTLAAKP